MPRVHTELYAVGKRYLKRARRIQFRDVRKIIICSFVQLREDT